jgi:hypothetical protein
MKAYEKAQLQEIAKESLRAYGLTDGSTLQISTDYIGNVGTAQSRVFIVRDGDLVNITALVARASGDTPKERKSDGRWVIVTKGMGYSRAQHITSNLSWALFGRADGMAYNEF